MSAIEQAMSNHRARSYAEVTGRPAKLAEPTGPVDFPRLLRVAALVGVPVARWDNRRGRHLIYRDGQEVEQ